MEVIEKIRMWCRDLCFLWIEICKTHYGYVMHIRIMYLLIFVSLIVLWCHPKHEGIIPLTLLFTSSVQNAYRVRLFVAHLSPPVVKNWTKSLLLAGTTILLWLVSPTMEPRLFWAEVKDLEGWNWRQNPEPDSGYFFKNRQWDQVPPPAEIEATHFDSTCR